MPVVPKGGGGGIRGGGGNGDSFVFLRLTNSQILNLPTVGLDVVLPKAANKLLVPTGGFVIVDARAGGYTNITAGAVIYFSSASSGFDEIFSPFIEATTFLALDANLRIAMLSAWGLTVNAGNLRADNLPLDVALSQNIYVAADNGAGGNFTGGNAANKMDIYIYYKELSLL